MRVWGLGVEGGEACESAGRVGEWCGREGRGGERGALDTVEFDCDVLRDAAYYSPGLPCRFTEGSRPIRAGYHRVLELLGERTSLTPELVSKTLHRLISLLA